MKLPNMSINDWEELLNDCGNHSPDVWGQLFGFIMGDSNISDDAIKCLKVIARTILAQDIIELEDKIDSISEYQYGDFMDYEAHQAARQCIEDIVNMIDDWELHLTEIEN